MAFIGTHFGYDMKGKEFNESPVSRYYLGSDPSEGALCARLSNRAFTVNIRKARGKCKLLWIRLFTRLRAPDGLTGLTDFLQKLLYVRVVK